MATPIHLQMVCGYFDTGGRVEQLEQSPLSHTSLPSGPLQSGQSPALEQSEGGWSPLPTPTAATADSPSGTPAPH